MTDYEIIGRLLEAALWGGLVGAEREYRSKSAGFRTMIMISIGSCFFTMMSAQIGAPGSADRIASNIVTGIGFLGAGVIFRNESRVNGITTAATIWVVAAVGMGIGSGYYIASAYASLMVLVVLVVLPHFERVIDRLSQVKIYSIKFPLLPAKKDEVEQLFRQYRLKYKLGRYVKKSDSIHITWQVYGNAKDHERFIAGMMNDTAIEHFEY